MTRHHPKRWIVALVALFALTGAAPLLAQEITGLISRPTTDGGQAWSIQLQTLLLLTSLAFIPAVLLMMTSFLRVVVVLSLVRTALGTPSAPPNQVLLGLALFISWFIMAPVLGRIYEEAWLPLTADVVNLEEFLVLAGAPLRDFMLAQIRETDLLMFADLAAAGPMQGPDDVPWRVLLPAFVTSELKTAFQIGFTLFIPFLIIDLAVASVLMSLGMMMVPPATISLPFKLMLFVLVDGWQLLVGSLAQSFFA